MASRLPLAPTSNTDVSIDPKAGRLSVVLFRFFYDLMSALNNRVPVTGSVTFAAATTAAVTFNVPEPADTYSVWFAPASNLTLWATAKTANGFTANASGANSTTVGWQIIRA